MKTSLWKYPPYLTVKKKCKENRRQWACRLCILRGSLDMAVNFGCGSVEKLRFVENIVLLEGGRCDN